MEPVEKPQTGQKQIPMPSQDPPQQLADLHNSTIGSLCPQCKQAVQESAVFCPHCGKQLQVTRPGIGKQIAIYLFSAVAAPLGLWWAWKYLRQSDPKTKNVGIIIIVISIFVIGVEAWVSLAVLNSVNSAFSTDLKLYQGTGY